MINNAICKFDFNTINNNNINISCELENIEEIKSMYIMNNPIALLLDENITLNYINFKNLTLYTLTLGNLLKGEYNQDYKNYTFYILDNNISNPIEEDITFSLPIKINDDEKTALCTILKGLSQFNIIYIIEDDFSYDYYNIKIENQTLYNYIILNNHTLYINISKEIFTTTLKAGYIKKISCNNKGLYSFIINGNSITKNYILKDVGKYFLNLSKFENPAICSINPASLVSSCSFNIKNDKEEEIKICSNINEDIKVSNLLDQKYIVINGSTVHLYGFDSLEIYTVVAGDLKKGKCKDNIFEFIFHNSIIYNNLSSAKDNIFTLNLIALPDEKLVAKCKLPKECIQYKAFNITCTKEGVNNCPIFPEDKELKVEDKNTNDIIIDSKRVFFKNLQISQQL